MGPKKTKSVVHPVKCTLEELYSGKVTRIKVNRDRVKKGDAAKITVKEKKVLEVRVDKGAPDGEKYIFHGEADEHPEKEAGDVVFVVAQQKHAVYKRRGADLLMNKEITLMEALCGVNFIVKFLDGTEFRVKSEEGEVIKPDQILTIEEKGMPFHKNPFKFGNLFIMFKISFPDKIAPTQKSQLQEAIGQLEGMKVSAEDERREVETKKLLKFDNS